jgi:uncharacterized protein (TIGR00369 family)
MSAMPAFRELLGIEVVSAEEGMARLMLQAEERHLNPGGTVHGGAIATLLDTAMGTAVATTTGGGEIPVTVEMKVNYLEPGQQGLLAATARIHKRGRRFTVLEADVVQEESGEVIAYATGTFTTVG